MITLEKYDSNSKQFSLLCESKGWFPKPDLQWLNSERDILTVGVTESQTHAELFSVKRRFTVRQNEIDTFYCRVTVGRHMMEEEIKPNVFNGELLHTVENTLNQHKSSLNSPKKELF